MALTGNTIPYIPTAATQQQQIAAINRVIDIINSFQQSITFSDDQNRRMIIGYQKDGWGAGKDFGIKISQEGVDVRTATESQLLFSMDIDSWRWFDQGLESAKIDRLGLTVSDAGVPKTLIGLAPDDKRAGNWVSKPGENVLQLLGGI